MHHSFEEGFRRVLSLAALASTQQRRLGAQVGHPSYPSMEREELHHRPRRRRRAAGEGRADDGEQPWPAVGERAQRLSVGDVQEYESKRQELRVADGAATRAERVGGRSEQLGGRAAR